MDLGLKGKRVLVTGGTKSIGRAIVDAFVAEGAVVGFCARDAKLVKERETDWRSKQHRVEGTVLDVTDNTALKKWIDGFAGNGGIDHFVANVSALGTEDNEAGWRKAIDIDIVSTVNAAHHARPHLEKTGLGGTLAIIGTVSFVEVSGPTSPYRSVKAALVPFAKSLAIDMAPKGVRANVVSPGTILEDATPGAASATPVPSATSACWRATRVAARARRRRSRRAWCSWLARRPRSSAARTSSSTAP